MLSLMTACGGSASDPEPTGTAQPAATATDPAPTTADTAAPAETASTAPATAASQAVDWTPQPGLALLEPESGAYFGVNLDWGNDSAAAFNERLGVDAAAYVQFAPFPFDDGWRENLRLYFEQVLAVRGIAVLTLEPTIPLDEITAAQAEDLAQLLAGWNAEGVGVLLRFAHEMNGSWYGWGQQPEAYVAAFRRVADAVHAMAPGTAMLWAPNYGAGYPFSGGAYEAKPA
ncbi:MAG TPA: glycosyl hydrolase, partial [Thermomicrobiales bacterium]|nr:glycosyl hydrolase [Thermomicrobiales bacterium]